MRLNDCPSRHTAAPFAAAKGLDRLRWRNVSGVVTAVLIAVKRRFAGLEAIFLLGAVGTMLAASVVSGKLAQPAGWHPLSLLFWSMVGACLLQVGMAKARHRAAAGGQGRPDDLTHHPLGLFAGGSSGRLVRVSLFSAGSGLLFAVPNAMAFSAVPHVGAGFVALCFAFPLVLTYALSLVLRLERFNRQKAVGTVLAVAGGAALAFGALNGLPAATMWVLAAMAMPVIIAAGNIYRSLLWPDGADPLLLSAGMMGFGALSLAACLAALDLSLLPERAAGAGAWGLLAFQTALFAVLYALYFRLQKLAGPVYLSQIGSVAAVAGLLMAYLLFGEVPGPAKVLAALLIGAGVFAVSRAGRQAAD